MKPLIQITTVPISYELKIQKAQVERHRGSAQLQISRDKGGLQVKSDPIKVKIDTFEARNSMVPTTPTSIKQAAESGKQAAYEATARWAADNHLMMKAKIGEDAAGQIAERDFMNNMKTGEFEMGFIPKAGPNIQWSDPDITVRYEMDKLNFDWRISQGDFQFIPGDISLEITQMPDVRIQYIGGPIYVPPSSDPNYEGIDVMA